MSMHDAARRAAAMLRERSLTITTAESCTGGLIAKLITDVPGASEVFECGIVSYSNEIKQRLLCVSEETLKSFGAVSEQTVREMSAGALRLSGADMAVAVSGIAGPDSDSTDKPVGLIWIAVNLKGAITVKRLENKFSKDVRRLNRESAAEQALELMCECLSDSI